MKQFATLAVDALISSGHIDSAVRVRATDEVKRVLTSADAEVSALIQAQFSHLHTRATASSKSRKKHISSKPRNRTAYNMFVKSENLQIRADLGDDAKVRGAVMKEAGKRWKALDAAGRAHYALQAEELNTKLAAEQPVAPATTPVIPPSDYTELVGPFPGTYAMGVFQGTKSFKTLDEAVVAMCENPNAAAIVQSKNGNRFRLRAGYKDKRNKPNKDRDGNATPAFVYNDNTTENTWLHKSALAHYHVYGPFTKDNPFCANKKIVSHSDSFAVLDVASPVITQAESDDETVQDITSPDIHTKHADVNATSEEVSDSYINDEGDDESDEGDDESDEEQCNLCTIRVAGTNGQDLFYCFQDTGHTLSYQNGRAPLPEHYTGKKVSASIIKPGCSYKDVVDGGILPEKYVRALLGE